LTSLPFVNKSQSGKKPLFDTIKMQFVILRAQKSCGLALTLLKKLATGKTKKLSRSEPVLLTDNQQQPRTWPNIN